MDQVHFPLVLRSELVCDACQAILPIAIGDTGRSRGTSAADRASSEGLPPVTT